MTTEAEEEIIDVGMETKEDHLVPSSPTMVNSPPGSVGNLILSPQSPFQAYSARLRSEADYERYKACKESQAQAFYKLATLTALQTYYQNHLSLNGSTSPLSPLFLQQHLLARAAVAAASNSTLTSPPANGAAIPVIEPPKVPGVDLTLKSVGLGSPPLKPFAIKRPSPESPKRTSPKKTKLAPRRKAARKLAFDEDKTSPVSGTIIRELAEGEEVPAIRKGDIPPEFNVVEVTEEAKAELAKIENKIGDYCCCLCKEVYPDAFGLAQHRCSMIVHVEYRCPECDKVFNCPANLASHRRWHKPKQQQNNNTNNNNSSNNSTGSDSAEENNNKTDQFTCEFCSKTFKRFNTMRKHIQQAHGTSEEHGNIDGNIHPSTNEDSSSSPTSSPMSSPTSKYSIAELLSKEPKPQQFQCRICAETLPNMAELSQHVTLQHISKGHPGLLQPLLHNQPFLFPH